MTKQRLSQDYKIGFMLLKNQSMAGYNSCSTYEEIKRCHSILTAS